MNQGHEIIGADGKVESDQQYRSFRWWNKGSGSRTSNNHFTHDVLRADGTHGYVGYGVDSLTVGLVAVCRVKFADESRDAVASLYPTAEEARITCAIVDAAAKTWPDKLLFRRLLLLVSLKCCFGFSFCLALPRPVLLPGRLSGCSISLPCQRASRPPVSSAW